MKKVSVKKRLRKKKLDLRHVFTVTLPSMFDTSPMSSDPRYLVRATSMPEALAAFIAKHPGRVRITIEDIGPLDIE